MVTEPELRRAWQRLEKVANGQASCLYPELRDDIGMILGLVDVGHLWGRQSTVCSHEDQFLLGSAHGWLTYQCRGCGGRREVAECQACHHDPHQGTCMAPVFGDCDCVQEWEGDKE